MVKLKMKARKRKSRKKPGAIMGRPKKWTAETVLREAEALIKYVEKKETVMPTIQEFCGARKYSSQRWSEWKKHPDFSEALKSRIADATGMCKDKFTLAMIKGGLTSKFDKAVTIFCLKNVAGWRDERAEIKVSATATATNDKGKEENKIEDDADTRNRLKRNMSILGRYGFSSEPVGT